MQKGYSQVALVYGICSTNHLCYFENGEKRLNGDILEALLEALEIKDITDVINTKHYNIDNLFYHLYICLSHLYLCSGKYEESIKWSKEALEKGDPILPVCNYVEGS